MKILYLHIGLQKTGTSSVQMHFMHPKGPLERAGIDCLQSVIAPTHAHHNAAWAVGAHRRYQPDLPGLIELVAAAKASEAERLFVSSEDFSLISSAQVEVLKQELADFDVRPILCLRNQLTWSESIFAQACKRGYLEDFDTFSKTLQRNKRVNFNEIYNAWASAFGHDKMNVLIYENYEDISDAFTKLLEIEVERPPVRKNESLNERFVQASQKVNKLCHDGALTFEGQTIAPSEAQDVAKSMLAAGSHHPQFQGSPVFLARDTAQAYLDAFAEMNAQIAKHVALPDAYFKVPKERRSPRHAYDIDVDFLIECIFDEKISRVALIREGAK